MPKLMTMNPLDLPVHPALVHFPIAMLIAAWVCVLLRHGLGARVWDDRVRLFEVIGLVTLPLVIVAGFVDLRGFDAVLDPRWDQPLVWHLLAGLATAALFTTHWVWRRGRDVTAGSAAAVDVSLSTAAAWTLVLTGAIAGEMVYAV